jgi:1-acyl-sn-glycerol-3-phosphate acyltransferase
MSTPEPANADPAPITEAELAPWLQVDSRAIDRVTRLLTNWLWDRGFRLRAHGVDRLPASGGFLLVPNHSSYADPFLHARPQSRHLRFMAKDSMFRWPVVRHIMKGGGGFPVRRGRGDQFAMELARRLLRDGHPVVVYPEGTRFRDSAELGPAKRGFARLALETGVPVVPAATWGVKRREVYGRSWWRLPRATVVYGEPIEFRDLEPTREHVDHVRDVVWARVQELYDEARALDAER